MNTQKTTGMTISTMVLAGILAIGTAALAVTNRKKLAGATTRIGEVLSDAALAMDPTFRPTDTTTQPNGAGAHGH